MGWQWKLLETNCTGCGICVDVCSANALQTTVEMAYPVPIEGKCEGCGDCVEECPFDAIVLTEISVRDDG